MTEGLNGDLLVADEKIEKGVNWQDTVKVPVAGDELEFGFSLLDEGVRQRVQDALSLDEFQEYRNQDVSEDHERLMELQRKDDLTEDEREELLELAEEVNPDEEGRDSLGDEAIEALMEAGKHALEPTEDDVSDVIQADPPTQQKVFGGEIPDHVDKETAREGLKEYMRERIEGQPFPIKFALGQNAYMETMSVLGNGFQNT